MTKEELQQSLTEKGIKFDKRMGVAKLEALLPAAEPEPAVEAPVVSEAELKRISDELTGKNAKPIEDLLKMAPRVDGEAQTASGIIIPQSVIANLSPTKWFYQASCTGSMCVIVRVMKNGHREEVREYSRAIHGDKFKELADGFVSKNNAK